MTVSAPPFAAPTRTPVRFDHATGELRIGAHERRVADPTEPTEVYSAYLSLLYAVRGPQPGERLALRTADLEALLLIVGDDPACIESRLVGLMGCTPEQATSLGRLLLRQRRATASLGIVAGLALGGAGVVTVTADSAPARSSAVRQAPAVAAPAAATAAPRPARPAGRVVGPVAATRTSGAASVVVAAAAAPAAPAPAPARPLVVAPAPDARVVLAVPVAVEPVDEGTYALPAYAEPVLDAPPPPVEVELPAADLGTPAGLDLDAVPVVEIGGGTDSSTGQGALPEVVEAAPAEPSTGAPDGAPAAAQ